MKPGALLGDRFEIAQRIAMGGMGQVFRGHDRASGEAVAIKVISEEQGHRSARFAREVELLSELSHPGIVRYIAHGEAPSGAHFLVMEWLDGEDLKARLEREALTVSEAVTLATRAAEALGAAHARGIVHRDLKPSNLFLPGGRIAQVKVLDFGIAHRDGRTQLTQTGMVVGTPGYMAPEQARNRGAIDARVDVFALGCVLFQCLTGTPAFDGDSIIGVLGKILFGAAPRVSALWPEVPEDLDALVAQMLASEPTLRPSDGANLAAALAALGPLAHRAGGAPRGDVVKTLAITGLERRFLSVILLGSVAEADEPALTEPALQRAITPYGGRLEQLADGTAIVVLEADRQVATDQAAQAARCALALRAVANGRPMAIAMGRTESTSRLPEGDVIDRASRLLSDMVRVSGDLPPIALDEVSAGLLDARFDVIERDAGLLLRGERVLMPGARTLVGRPTQCVGRDWELTLLAGILDECIDEAEARVVVVTAAAGVGKSRLAAEFVTRIQQRGEPVAIWVGRGDSLRAGSTLDLLAQALRGALGIHGGEPLEDRRDTIRARVAAHVRASEQKRVAEFLGELVGAPLPGGDHASAALKAARQDAQLMNEQMRRAWMDFLEAEAAVHPVVLVLEDLHWGDFGTVRFIDAALRDRRERPWMVLALARPEVFEVFPRLWAERQNVQEVRLKELGRKAGVRLVRQVLGDRVGPETMERMVTQADGNAFYLEELIRAVAEGKDNALPDTVLAMVETRLGRLTIEARRVLRAASLFGQVCWESGVTVLLGGAMGTTMVGEWLARLVEQEVLVVRSESRFPEQRELGFRHALLREGAYATLTEQDKRLGHRLAGEWLAQHGEDDPMVLAGHFERGGEGARAASYYLSASEQAFHILDLEVTVARAALGLGCEASPELRIALLGMRCEACFQGRQMVSVVMPDAEELMRSAPRGSIPWVQGMIVYLQGTMLAGRMGDFLAAIEVLRAADPPPEAAGKMVLLFITAVCMLDFLGQVPEGTLLEQRLFAIVRSSGDREPLARFWWNVIIGMRAGYAHEDPWTGLQYSDAIQAVFDMIGGERVFLNMQLARGLNLWYLGASAAAERILEPIVAADDTLGPVSSLRRFHLSWLLADRGALDEARALATRLCEYGQAYQLPLEELRGRWVLAEVLRRMGDLEAAERELQAALAMAIPLDHPGVLATLSVLRLAQGRAGEALVAAEDAVARCTAMDGCGMFRGAFVRLAHAEALHATGAHDAARHAIAAARTRLFAIADRIADPDYKASFLENVPENARTLALARAWLGDATPSA
jgi:eukaryotic-like serine/threonine-protein kinase